MILVYVSLVLACLSLASSVLIGLAIRSWRKYIDQIPRALGVLGKSGGDRRSVNLIKGEMAKGFIDKNYGLIKIIADRVLGIDADELIDEYGAENILTAIGEIGPKLGLNLEKGLEGLNIGSNIGSTKAWYEKE